MGHSSDTSLVSVSGKPLKPELPVSARETRRAPLYLTCGGSIELPLLGLTCELMQLFMFSYTGYLRGRRVTAMAHVCGA